MWVRQAGSAAGGTAADSEWQRGTVVAPADAQGAVSIALEPPSGRGPPTVVSAQPQNVEPANPALLDGVRCVHHHMPQCRTLHL